jgi:hypothetical protein
MQSGEPLLPMSELPNLRENPIQRKKERQNRSDNYALFLRVQIGLEGNSQAEYLARLSRCERLVILCGLAGSSAGAGVGLAGSIGGTYTMSFCGRVLPSL